MISFPLSSISEVIRGVSFSKDEGDTLPSEERLPIIRAGSIQDTLLLNEGQIWVPKNKVHEKQKIRRDDIVMCTSSGSSDLVGKCAKSDVDFEGSFGAFCAGIRPNKEKVSASYLFHFLNSPKFRTWSSSSSGANIKNIRVSELAEFKIPLPPLEEQKRIAAILDKADAIRRKRQESIKLADEFLRAVFLDMFGDPLKWDINNSNGWDVKPIGEISYLKRGYDLPVQDRKDGQYPIYAANGIVGFHETCMAKGPGVITGRSGTLGKVIYTDNDYWPLNTSLYVKDFCGNEPKYIEWFLRLFRLDRYHQGAGVPTLNRNLFLEELSLRPPLGLQINFVKKINKAEALINKMASNIDNDIFNALSQKVFSIN